MTLGPVIGVTRETTVSLLTEPVATSIVAHTVATALGPSVASYIRLDRPTTMTEIQCNIRSHGLKQKLKLSYNITTQEKRAITLK